jgi:hypothetical protein
MERPRDAQTPAQGLLWRSGPAEGDPCQRARTHHGLKTGRMKEGEWRSRRKVTVTRTWTICLI